MTIHLTKFVDRLRGSESRGSRDFVMSMTDAKDLQADITRLLIELHELREQAIKNTQEDVVTIKMDGGTF